MNAMGETRRPTNGDRSNPSPTPRALASQITAFTSAKLFQPIRGGGHQAIAMHHSPPIINHCQSMAVVPDRAKSCGGWANLKIPRSTILKKI